MSLQRPNLATNRPSGEVGHAEDPELSRSRPLLAAHLCDAAWSDGTPKQAMTLLLFAEEGQWKACLGNRDDDCSLWASGASVEMVLDVLEARLADDRPDWRKRKAYPPPRRK